MNIVIIGGSACGPKAAARARRCDPKAKITVLEQAQDISVATCSLPYYISGVIESRKSLIVRSPAYFKQVMDIDVLTGMRAMSIDRKTHKVQVFNLITNKTQDFPYDKLVITTGASPKIPPIEGRNLKNVFTLSNIQDADAIKDAIPALKTKKAVIIGAGLIGLEMAENLSLKGFEVTVIETLAYPLPTLLDPETGDYLKKHLSGKGVKMLFGERVTGFEGDKDGIVRQVIVGGKELESELVLLAIGTAPNVKLAKDTGLAIGTTGGISVNEYLETSDPDIYAGGDCAENTSLVTGKKTLSPLGSTANKHGRVIGTNVSGGRDIFSGVVGTAIAKVFDYNVARTGLTEFQAKQEGFSVVTCLIPSNEYVTYYPGSKEFMLKIIADKTTGKILGGQAVGPGNTAKRIDVLATALFFGATAGSLANLDLAYAPPYNSALDPLHHAANVLRNKISGMTNGFTPAEVKKMIDSNEDFILLDVRNPDEWKECSIDANQVVYISLPELRNKINTLPKDKIIITFCRSSVRAYQAQNILKGSGFGNTAFMDGSILAWPYDVCVRK